MNLYALSLVSLLSTVFAANGPFIRTALKCAAAGLLTGGIGHQFFTSSRQPFAVENNRFFQKNHFKSPPRVDEQVQTFFDNLKYSKSHSVKSMLEGGIDPNLIDENGNDFFYYAFKYANIGDLLPLAIEKGLQVNRPDQKTGLLPLDRALQERHFTYSKILVEAGALTTNSLEDIVVQAVKTRVDYIVDKRFPTSIMFTPHRFILAVYRASRRHPLILEKAKAYCAFHDKPNFLNFLVNIDEYDQKWP